MIREIRLNSNDGASTARFWSAIFNVPAEDMDDGRYRIAPVAGPAVVVTTTTVWQTISRYSDMTAVVDHGAADRLRALGYEVAVDGSQAVDLNGTDGTVFLVARGWDGVSEFYEDDPDDAEKARIEAVPPTATTGRVRRILTDSVAEVARLVSAWFDVPITETLPSGIVRIIRGDTLFRIEPVTEPEEQIAPFAAADYVAAVARVEAAGFTVVPSPTHPATAGHCDVGGVSFLLMQVER